MLKRRKRLIPVIDREFDEDFMEEVQSVSIHVDLPVVTPRLEDDCYPYDDLN